MQVSVRSAECADISGELGRSRGVEECGDDCMSLLLMSPRVFVGCIVYITRTSCFTLLEVSVHV